MSISTRNKCGECGGRQCSTCSVATPSDVQSQGRPTVTPRPRQAGPRVTPSPPPFPSRLLATSRGKNKIIVYNQSIAAVPTCTHAAGQVCKGGHVSNARGQGCNARIDRLAKMQVCKRSSRYAPPRPQEASPARRQFCQNAAGTFAC